MASSPGYSGTPLARKLGISAGMVVVVRNAPGGYLEWLAPLPDGVRFAQSVNQETALMHLFVDRLASLQKQLTLARKDLPLGSPLWVSWPKKSSGIKTDVTEDTIRKAALPLGFVDVKVCAVSEIWSGLKLVVRKELR